MMRDIGAFFYCAKKQADKLIMSLMKAGNSSPEILSSFVIEKNSTFYKGNMHGN